MPIRGNKRPPGPKGWPVVGVALEVRGGPLLAMQRFTRDYGDIVYFHVMMQERVLLNGPEFIEEVLVRQHAKFHKSELTRRITGRMLGQGLLTSEGDFWRRQRRLVQPAFHRGRINEYAATMLSLTGEHIARWRDGDEHDIAREMMALTLDIAVQTLFGTTLPGEAHRVGEAMTFLMRYSLSRLRLPIRVPENWPTPKNRRANRELEFINSLLHRMIDERRKAKNPEQFKDLLSLLMGATDDDGNRMDEQQLHDEAMTLFIAGHETTSQMLAWTWYLLSENSNAEQRLHEELKDTLGDRPLESTDLARLPYLNAVMNEVLRLYPPAYIMAREVIEPVEIGGYEILPKTTVLFSQWVTQRDPRFYDSPDEFRPERWIEGLADRLPAGAYYPFGDGPRRCIGQGFALLEAAVVISTIMRRFRFDRVSHHPVEAEPLVTLRPKNGIRMIVRERK